MTGKRCLVAAVMVAAAFASAMAQKVSVATDGGATVYYDTFIEAVEMANSTDGAVIKLLEDNDLDYDVATFTSAATIDLNGCELCGFGSGLITVKGKNGHLTIMDSGGTGSIYFEGEFPGRACCMSVENQASLTIDGGKITACRSFFNEDMTGLYAVRLKYGSSFLMTGGYIDANIEKYCYGLSIEGNSTARIDGGTIKAISDDRFGYSIFQHNGTLTINEGTFITHSQQRGACLNMLRTGATATINGGKFLNSRVVNTVADIRVDTIADEGYEKMPPSVLRINGGMFAHEFGLEPRMSGRYVLPVVRDSNDYEEGYRVYIGDEPYTTDIARNLTTGKGYTTLEAALEAAVKGDTVSLVNDYTLRRNVSVKQGVMLLVPYDILNTCPTDKPEGAYFHEEEVVYRTLTVADGVRIDVFGEMSVSAFQSAPAGGFDFGSGVPNGNHALVVLGKGAEINVAGNLYCWGYVSGEGKVTVNSGAALYEPLIITDHRGGTISYDIEDKMYPYIQYYVQNVETPVTFLYGARNICATNMGYENSLHPIYDIQYVAPDKAGSDAEGLYRMKKGSVITRRYDAATDRMEFVFDGDVKLGTLTVSYDDFNINSEYYTFPLNANVSMTIRGGELTMPYDYYMEPGTRITVAPDAVMTVNKKLYIYDREDWKNIYCLKGYLLPLEYTAANGHENRSVRWGDCTTGNDEASYAKITNSAIDVQGTLRVKGQIFASQHAADNVAGSGTVLFLNKARQESSSLFQAIKVTSQLDEIPFRSLPQTAGVLPGDVDGDRSITMADANMVVNAYLGMGTVNPYVADMDGDGFVTMADANAIVNAYLGM